MIEDEIKRTESPSKETYYKVGKIQESVRNINKVLPALFDPYSHQLKKEEKIQNEDEIKSYDDTHETIAKEIKTLREIQFNDETPCYLRRAINSIISHYDISEGDYEFAALTDCDVAGCVGIRRTSTLRSLNNQLQSLNIRIEIVQNAQK